MKNKVEILKSKTDEVTNEKVAFELIKISKFSHCIEQSFYLGQIKRILEPDKKYSWASEDIAAAISLRSACSNDYKYFRKIGYPLPASSTLRI